MKNARRKEPTSCLAEFRDGKDESNLAEFPVALLTDSAPRDLKTIEFEDTLDDWETGLVITRRVRITGSDKFGLPTAKDEEVLVALLQLTKLANNFTSPEVAFNKRQVIEILGWKNRGWAYDWVEESLHRWKGVSIHYWNAWRDNTDKKWKDSAAVGVIDYFLFADGRQRPSENKRRDGGMSRFVWNKIFFESFENGYLKNLDFATYRSLERPAAKRAYRFLDKRFFHRARWEFDLRQFACEKLGFSRAYSTGQLKERLHPALFELEKVGFIEPATFRKERPKVWTVAIEKKASMAAKDRIGSSSTTDRKAPLAELVGRGIEKSVAEALVQEFSGERIAEKLAYYDWLKGRAGVRVSKNGPGFLVSAIRKDYAPSKEFIREKSVSNTFASPAKQATVAERKRKESRTDAESSGVERAIAEFLGELSVAEFAELIGKAVDESSPVEQRIFQRLEQQGGQLHAEMLDSLARKYVVRHGLHLVPRVALGGSSLTGHAEG